MRDWGDYQFVLAVARGGSLSAAAQALGVNHSTVLRRLNALEERLGVALFDRENGYALTPAGRSVQHAISGIFDTIEAVESRLRQQEPAAEGILKISTRDALGYYWLPRHIHGFCHQYPAVQVDVDITTVHADLSKGEADILITDGLRQPDYALSLALADISYGLYAARSYIKERGLPEGVADFRQHTFILPNERLAHVPVQAWLRRHVAGQDVRVRCDKLSGIYRFALRGLGLAPLPHFIGSADPMLQKVMDMPSDSAHKIWLSSYPTRQGLPRVRAFIDYLRSALVKDQASRPHSAHEPSYTMAGS